MPSWRTLSSIFQETSPPGPWKGVEPVSIGPVQVRPPLAAPSDYGHAVSVIAIRPPWHDGLSLLGTLGWRDHLPPWNCGFLPSAVGDCQ